MRLAHVSVLALTLGLAACTTPQERAQRMQAEMAELMVVYGPACTRLGFGEGSDPWRQCVLQLSTREELRQVGSGPGYYGHFGRRHWGAGGYWGPYW